MSATLLDIQRLWVLLLLRGLIAILFAILTFTMPQVTLQVIGLLIGLYALFIGILDIIRAIRLRLLFRQWWFFLLQGLLAISFAVLTFMFPSLPLLLLVFLLALWILTSGLLMMWFGQLMRKVGGDWSIPVGVALFSILLGLLLIVWPQITLTLFLYFVALFLLISGLIDLFTAFRLRKTPQQWVILINTSL